MKVLQINSVCGIGSTGRIATDIHNILIEQGHESYIAYGRDLPKNCDNALKIGTKIDNYTHVAKTRLFDKHGFGSKKSTIQFINTVKELDPDIIHLHNIHGYYINIEILFNYLKEANKPVVWTLHDCWSFTGHCSHFDHIGCQKWETGCFDCPQLKEYPKSLLVDNSKWNFLKKKNLFTGIKNLTIITPSKWLNNIVRKSFLGSYKIITIPNGIDLDIFKPSVSNLREKYDLDNKYIILGVSNIWNAKKGLDKFKELALWMEEDEQLILVGTNKKQNKSLPRNIITIERTDSVEQLAEIYSAADVFLNLSHEETMGLVTIEALACGTPVIVNNSTALPEIIDTEKCGIVTENSMNSIRNAIKKIKNNAIVEENYINCASRFEKRKQYEKYLNIYRKSIFNKYI